jgi:subtilisin family serine protease
VTLAAPGQDITSTFINDPESFPDGWALWSGTSFATPRVAAAIGEGRATFGGYRALT